MNQERTDLAFLGEEGGDGIYVCWDCATLAERHAPALGNDPAGEACGRCGVVSWELVPRGLREETG